MAFARAIVAAYRRYGQDPAQALKLAQITPAKLQQPDARITARQMEVLSGAAMQELDDEGLGAFSRQLPWGSYGMLARASLTSPDLGMALKRWCRHHALLADDIRLELVVTGDSAAIVIDERAHLRRQGEARASSAWCTCCATSTAWPAGTSTRASRCKARAFRSPRRRMPTRTATCFPAR